MKHSPKRITIILPLAMLLCLTLLLGACASDPSTAPTTTPSDSSSASTATTPQSSSSSSDSAVIHTASVSVKGTTETVLTDAQGKTLYYFTPDTIDKVACTGSCADTWPPAIFKGTGTPTSDPSLPGTLSTHSNANGNQIVYNNHYLYTFSGDSAAGQANGQGVGNKWFVATPDLK